MQMKEKEENTKKDKKFLWDHNSFMKSAKIIGMREGREEGREEGRKEGHKEGRKEGRKEGYREALVSIVIKKLQKGMISRGNCRLSGRGCLDDTENL